jgi:tetratricopeptide (TPR) repeat protein
VLTIERRYGAILSTLLFFSAFGAKESALVWIPLIGFFTCLTRYNNTKIKLKRASFVKLLYSSVVAGICFLILRTIALGEFTISDQTGYSVDNPLVTLAPFERIQAAFALLGLYLVRTLLPIGFGVDYSSGSFSLQGFTIVVGAISACALFVIAFYKALTTQSPKYVGITFFFISFLITSNILFPIGTIFAGRLVYLPAIGVALCLGALLSGLPWTLLRTCILIPYCLVLAHSIPRFASPESLSDAEILRSDVGVKSLVNRAVIMSNQKKYTEALTLLLEAERREPMYADIYYYRAILEFARNNYMEVRTALERVFQRDPGHTRALLLIGKLEFELGNLEEAKRAFQYYVESSAQQYGGIRGLFEIAMIERDQVSAKKNAEWILQTYPEIAERDNIRERMRTID